MLYHFKLGRYFSAHSVYSIAYGPSGHCANGHSDGGCNLPVHSVSNRTNASRSWADCDSSPENWNVSHRRESEPCWLHELGASRYGANRYLFQPILPSITRPATTGLQQRNRDRHSVVPSPAAPVGQELGGATGVLFVCVWPHHSASPPTALAESTGEDPVQACCSCVQVSARDSTVVYLADELEYTADFGARRRLRSASSLSLNVRRTRLSTVGDHWSVLPCCCCPYLEQSASTCHVRTIYVRFLRSPQAFPFLLFPWFLPQLLQCLRSVFYLLTYLLYRPPNSA